MTTDTALVVDDTETGRRMQRILLIRNGGWADGRIFEAATLKDAVTAARKWRPALVSLDLNLPDSQGVDTLRGFLEQSRLDPSVVWVVTANSDDPALAVQCLEWGVAGFVAVGNEPWRAPRDDFTVEQKAELAKIVAQVMESILPAKIDEALEKQRVLVQLRQNQLARKIAQALLMLVLTGLGTFLGPYLWKVLSAGFWATFPGGDKS